MELKIEYMALEKLKPYEKNARKHQEADLSTIKASITEFGMSDPIGVWGKDNIIVEGHGRYLACKELGIAEVPVIHLDHLSDEQRRAYALAHNKTAEMSEWDFDLLGDELADIFDIDMTDFGFDFAEEEEEEVEVIEDEVPEVPTEPKTKIGDIYQLGRHRLMCGDSTSVTDIDVLLNGNKIDMIYTDPPYGMNLDTDYSGMKNNLDFANEKNFTGGKKYAQGIVDDFEPEMINTIMSLNVKETFLWGADYFAELLPDKNDGSWVVWDKRANGNDDIEEDYSSDKMYGSCFELCWSKNKHKRDIARVKWAGVFGTEQEFDHKRHHPTQKPVKLSEWFLKRYSKENENILDLFGGSGSTMIACEQLNRNCFMMELDAHYVDVIIERWEQFTGQKAVLVNG
jgi:site-specific DNA-methyltransferase (adenine-specific)